ncbi:Uncharacterised protein [Vibrio cholerae]|uniref:Uncharacterized protein n=1 Tax=Vibrio cholerae TaxID=666 RepID=A0A655X4K7_VIBCL|nr:Uncharacterised protein [Vibrio cholerae]
MIHIRFAQTITGNDHMSTLAITLQCHRLIG